MTKYNFQEDKGLGETIRLEDLNDKIKKIENKDGFDLGDTLPGVNLKQHLQKNISYNDKYTEQRDIKSKPVNSKKDNFNLYLVLAVLFGLVLFAAGFVFSFLAGQENTKENITKEDTQDEIFVDDGEIVSYEAFVKNVDDNGIITFYDIESGKNMSVKLADNTDFKADDIKNQSNLEEGSIVEIVTNGEGRLVKEINNSKSLWSMEEQKNVTVVADENKILIDSKEYQYTSDSLFRLEGKLIDPSKIENIDIIDIKGTGNIVWTVDVKTYHGFIGVTNFEGLENIKISVDGKDPVTLNEQHKIPATPGHHEVVITADNIEDYSKGVDVVSGEDQWIDLQSSLEKTYFISVKANVSGINVEIDGQSVKDVSKPFSVPIGSHVIRVHKDGYIPQEHTVNDNGQSLVELNLILEEEIKKGMYSFVTNPDRATVLVDGVNIGETPTCAEISYGNHRIVIKKDGYQEISVIINVEKENEVLNYTMQYLD